VIRDIKEDNLYEILTKTEYRELESLQEKYFDEGFGKDQQHIQKECWNRAFKEFVEMLKERDKKRE
jgi:hypothetical protein